MKRTLTIVALAAVMGCILTACGKKDSNSTTESTTMAQDESSGINSATDASLNSEIYGKDNIYNDINNESGTAGTDGGIVENIVTDAEGIVDDLVSTGEDIVDDAGDALTGDDN